MQRPFASLEQALEAVRRHKAGNPGNACIVYLREGVYFRSASFDLTEKDRGTASAPLTIAAYPGERVTLHGGAFLAPEWFAPVNDTAFLKRLQPEVRDRLVQIDLKKLGITRFGILRQHGFGTIPEPAPLELFINGKRQPLARFPDEGQLPIGPVYDPGAIPRKGDFSGRGAEFGYQTERLHSWLNARDIWLNGWFSFGYNDDNLCIQQIDTTRRSIRLAHPHLYGVLSSTEVDTAKWIDMAGHSLRGYYAYNLPEELDRPGEWFLDRSSGFLYLYPPPGFDESQVEVSLLEEPLIRLLNTAHIRLENLEFRTTRGMGIYLEHARHIELENCTFSHLGTVGISAGQPLQNNRQGYGLDGAPLLDDWRAENFDHIAIHRCRFFNTGAGGIILTGGNRLTLTPAENKISHCTFYRTDQRHQTYAPAVKLAGVGTVVEYCLFADLTHMAIGFSGNDHRIQYNRFERLCTGTDDAGAIMTGRDPSSRGSVIQYNHFRDILPADEDSQVSAIFLDDGTGGIDVGHNFFERVGSTGDKELFGAVAIHGGHDNNIHHNVFLDCPVALGNNYWPDERWKAYLESPVIQERLKVTVDIRSLLYRQRYPELTHYFSDPGPRLNRFAENILINSTIALNAKADFFFNHLESPGRLEHALQKIGFDLRLAGPENP